MPSWHFFTCVYNLCSNSLIKGLILNFHNGNDFAYNSLEFMYSENEKRSRKVCDMLFNEEESTKGDKDFFNP